ncbi:MAG: MFS transporter [Nitratireductor sp.]|nr:MFS transporter [Nitratireductor sp.]
MNTAENAFGTPVTGPVEGPEKIDIRAVVAAIATISAVGVAIGLSFPLLSILLEQRGFSSTLIGTNTAMAGLAAMAAVPFVNPIARRIGLVNTLVLSAIIAALSLAGFYVFSDIRAWFLLRISFHGAITASFVLSEYWINSSVPSKRRGFILGIYATVLSLGFATGPALLALLGSKGVTPFATGIVIILISVLPALMARGREPQAQGHPQSRSVLRYVLLVPLATAAAFVFGAVEQAGLALFPVYGSRTGYGEQQISLLLMVLAFGNVALQIPLGLWSDRIGDKRWLLFGCAAVGAAGVGALPWVIQFPALLTAGIFVWGGVTAGMYTVGLAHLGGRLSGQDLAQANAAFILCYAIGMVVGPYAAGQVMDIYDPHGFAWSLCAMFVFFMVVVIVRSITGPKR